MSKWIFITGGCGYIASHVASLIKDTTDFSVMLIDARHHELIHARRYSDTFITAKTGDQTTLAAIMDYRPHCVIHCAGTPMVDATLVDPMSFWEKDVIDAIKLLRTCTAARVPSFIYTSSVDVYGGSDVPITEISPLVPRHISGTIRLAIESAIKDSVVSTGMSSAILRLSNVAGSHPTEMLGEMSEAPGLIPQAMEAMIHGQPMNVYGNDLPTKDGTMVRDYVHVMDVASAIVKTLKLLEKTPGSHVMNIANGESFSTQQVLDRMEMMFNSQIPYRYAGRIHGEPPSVLIDNSMATDLIGWKPTRDLSDILRDSYRWYTSQIFKSYKSIRIKHLYDPAR